MKEKRNGGILGCIVDEQACRKDVRETHSEVRERHDEESHHQAVKEECFATPEPGFVQGAFEDRNVPGAEVAVVSLVDLFL